MSQPTYLGGLGFGFKWNMGWMHDTLEYFSHDPIYRSYHHNELTFSLMYAFSENFILPLSHDEVVHGKGSLTRRCRRPWQKLANLRCLYAYMWAHPGKKLLFMGSEIAQEQEWNFEQSLDWHLLERPEHAGIQNLVRDLNGLLREEPALFERDCEESGFQWLVGGDLDNSVFAFARHGEDGRLAIVASNFTPVPRPLYRIGVPQPGFYHEILNTDAAVYGGGNLGNFGGVEAEAEPSHGEAQSIVITVPPLATVAFSLG